MSIIDSIRYRNTPYLKIGGKKTIDQIVDRFYYIMDNDEYAKDCRAIHQDDLSMANEKLKLFLYGWLGGPQDFQAKYGHPRLRMRHFPFKIREKEVVQWIYCMEKAIHEFVSDSELKTMIFDALTPLAYKMQNS